MMAVRTFLMKTGALIALEGRMDAASRDLLQAAGDRMAEMGAKHIVVDMTRLTYISSAGLGVLVRLSSILGKAGCSVSLSGANGVLRTVLEISKINTLFRIYDTADDAMSAEAG